jgi:hypothetical protein
VPGHSSGPFVCWGNRGQTPHVLHVRQILGGGGGRARGTPMRWRLAHFKICVPAPFGESIFPCNSLLFPDHKQINSLICFLIIPCYLTGCNRRSEPKVLQNEALTAQITGIGPAKLAKFPVFPLLAGNLDGERVRTSLRPPPPSRQLFLCACAWRIDNEPDFIAVDGNEEASISRVTHNKPFNQRVSLFDSKGRHGYAMFEGPLHRPDSEEQLSSYRCLI